MDKIKKIQEVKRMTIDALGEVVKSNEITDPQSQFDQVMQLLQFNSDPDLVQAAFYAANSIEDKNIKADSLSQLLGELSFIEDQLSAGQLSQPAVSQEQQHS